MEFEIVNLEPISQYQYLSSNKRYVTKRGKAWMKEYKKQLTEQMEKFKYTKLKSCSIKCEITLTFCNRRKNDIDNGLHYCLDGMENIVYENDRYITHLVATKCYKKKEECCIKIKISNLETTPQPASESCTFVIV